MQWHTARIERGITVENIQAALRGFSIVSRASQGAQ